MKLKTKLTAVFAGTLCLLTSGAVFAAEAKASAPYGMAGCGFATLFIKDNGAGPQIGASLINGIFSGVTNSSAILSGSLNCVENRSKVAMNEKEYFITANLASLSKEAAQGSGEHISALAHEFGCPQNEFAKMSQTHYKEIYSVNEPSSVLNKYLEAVNADENLAKSCLKVI